MINKLEGQFANSLSNFESTSSVFAHIDGNRCCRTLNIEFLKGDHYESRIFKFHQFENFRPMYESLPASSYTWDHDHLQIYWNNQDNAWQVGAILLPQ